MRTRCQPALGSSGDRPAALAALMGIIVNDGVRLPTARIERLHFAAEGEVYELEFRRVPYAVEKTAEKIYGIPELDPFLGDRLRDGR